MNSRTIWNLIRESLKKNLLLGNHYGIYIRPLKAIAIKDGVLYLEAPNKYTLSIIKKRYYELIKDELLNIDSSLDLELLTAYDMESLHLDYDMDEEDREYVSVDTRERNNLIPSYTFENFVIGESNKMAHATAWAIAENPGNAYNPFFIYGKSGIGKTHLMQAICHKIAEDKPHLRVMYVTSEQFTNELIESIRHKKNEEFRNKYRGLDVLMIDDIQFLEKKIAIQEEFFHTFNDITSRNGQIVISSDRFPKEIESLQDRLVSRFESGVLADIAMPELETRIAILRSKCELEKYDTPDEILVRIAEAVDTNIRELIGLLVRARAYVNLETYTYEEAIPIILREMYMKNSKKINPDTIIDYIAKDFNMDPEDIKGKVRTQEISFVRHIAMYVTRELTDLSYPDIANSFGDRHHSTVISAWNKIRELTEQNPELKRQVASLIKDIKKL